MKALLAGILLASCALAQTVITFPNANVFLSPYAWRVASGTATCPTGGGYIKFQVTGTTSIVANVDTTLNSGQTSNAMPAIKVIVSTASLDGTASYVQLPANNTSSTAITLASGLTSGVTYSVILSATGGNPTVADGWTGTAYQTKINSLQFTSGATLSPATLRAKTALFFGDSYLMAYFGGSTSGATYTFYDFTLSWPFFVAYAFGAEYLQVGIGAQGWVRDGTGGYPNFPASWAKFDATHAKTYGTVDYVFIAQGTNDHDESSSAVQANVVSTLAAMRAAMATATIFVIIPIDRQQASAIATGVIAFGDANVFTLDPGSEYQYTVFAGAPTWASPDGLHLDAIRQSLYTGFVTKQAATIIANLPGGGSTLRGSAQIR